MLEAVSDNGNLFTFKPGVLGDEPHGAAIVAWLPRVRTGQLRVGPHQPVGC